MPKRMHDTEIWEEDWFIDLPQQYKLFFLFIKDKCDHSGMWRPNRRKFTMTVPGMLHYDEFIRAVNKDPETGIEKKRIVILENGKWFITRFISFQLGGRFILSIGAHRGTLKLLISNGVHPKDVPNMDWCGIEEYDLETLKELGHGKGLYALSQGKVRDKEREKDPVHRNKGKGGAGENPIFAYQHLYEKDWNQISTIDREFKGATPEGFAKWKQFVDFVIEKQFDQLFTALFVTPGDFTILYMQKGFTESMWEPVIQKVLATGVEPKHNLYFRLPEFMKYLKGGKSTSSDMSANASSSYEKQEKW